MKVVFVDAEDNVRLRVMALPHPPAVGDQVILFGRPRRDGRAGDEVWIVADRRWLLRPDSVYASDSVLVKLRRFEPRLAVYEVAEEGQ